MEVKHKQFEDGDAGFQQLDTLIKSKFEYIKTARPTAVNIARAADKFVSRTTELVAKRSSDLTINKICTVLVEEMEAMLSDDLATNQSIGKYGAEHILKNSVTDKVTILTHCNTGSLATGGYGTALGVVRTLHETGRLEHVYCTETRPYNQGARLTAYEIVHDNIPGTLVCDSMGAILMKERGVTAVVVGADRVVSNGDTANKIGTYQLAIVAKYHNIPFYVAAPLSSIDFNLLSGDQIIIEERPHSEMVCVNGQRLAAEGIGVWNPAFDVTTAELITGGIITEKGVYKATQLKSLQ